MRTDHPLFFCPRDAFEPTRWVLTGTNAGSLNGRKLAAAEVRR